MWVPISGREVALPSTTAAWNPSRWVLSGNPFFSRYQKPAKTPYCRRSDRRYKDGRKRVSEE
jgi:hypothetical protein